MTRGSANLLLFSAAAVWGAGFVAQQMGMEFLGPLTYNSVRFTLGALGLLPLVLLRYKSSFRLEYLRAGLLLGFWLFIGALFQQVGLLYTTAGKAGFITGLYLVIIPILARLFSGTSVTRQHGFAVLLSLAGLFLLSVNRDLSVEPGDLIIFGCAISFAIHIIYVERITQGAGPKLDPWVLAFMQYVFCTIFCFAISLPMEGWSTASALAAWKPLLFSGPLSISLAYTAQLIGQRYTSATEAGLIMSAEAVFAAYFGWLLKNEILSDRQTLGCAIILLAVILAQTRFGKSELRSAA